MSFVRLRLFRSESFRLAAIYAGLFLISTLLLMALVFFGVSRSFEASELRAADDDLAAIQRAYRGGIARGKALHEAKEMIDDRLLAADAADLFLLQSGAKKIAGNLPLMTPRDSEQRFAYPSIEGHVVLGRGKHLAPGIYVFVGRDLETARAAERQVLDTFALVLAASLVIASGGGVLLSRSFLKRIDAITATCRSIMAGRLGERIPVDSARNEISRLAATINEMLDRIAALMDSLRQVSNDIAHDLRTPLAHLRAKLERARVTARSVEDYSATMDDAIEDADALMGIFAALLRIAQIEAGARRAGMKTLDLSEILLEVAALYEPLIGDDDRPFQVAVPRGLTVHGDKQLLFRLFANLLDNAIRHTRTGTAMSLEAEMLDGQVVVAVSDRGPGIPPEDRELVFRRFFRREQSRTTPGTGLGLALASAIAELHGTKITLSDNCPGLRATARFELAAFRTPPPSLAIGKEYSPNDHQSYSET
ncbi:MAG TPA: ATP-binding protein [Rhizomicrobium sp.]|nr:ATP-binding protein [Rhizomicrobium sp.]